MSQKNIKNIIFDWQGVLSKGGVINEEIIDWIKNNKDYGYGILTNYPADFEVILSDLKIKSLFKAVISPTDGVSKPNPEAYFKVLKEMESDATESLFTDDSFINVKAARKIGMETVLYEDNRQFFERLKEKIND